jgi:hypothetical protein
MMHNTPSDRIYLYVSPDEYPRVEAAGARWDGESKRWYIPDGAMTPEFVRWSGEDIGEPEFGIVSEEAFVASAQVSCVECHQLTDVICIYCESGTDVVRGEDMTCFTLSNVWAINQSLAKQLEQWPFYRKDGGVDDGNFSNYCLSCGAVKEDYWLHAEPGDVFFAVSDSDPGVVTLTPLYGPIQVNGDCSFGI